MSDWGCEYVDDGLYGRPFVAATRPDYLRVPMSLLDRIVDKPYLIDISNTDQRRLDNLALDISQNGIREPGLLIYDLTRIRLQDGNHRYLCCQRLGITHLDVILRQVPKIRGYGMPLQSVLPELLQIVYGF